jgi:hypothetical protein
MEDRADEVFPRDLAIAAEQIILVAGQQVGAVFAVIARNFVPRHRRLQVMGDMQVVVEKQHPKEMIRFHRSRPVLRQVAEPMLNEGAQQPQAHARIGDQRDILPPRHPADAGDEIEQHADCHRMNRPMRQVAAVAAADAPDLARRQLI